MTRDLEHTLIETGRLLIAAGADDPEPPAPIARVAALWRRAVLQLVLADVVPIRHGCRSATTL